MSKMQSSSSRGDAHENAPDLRGSCFRGSTALTSMSA